MNPERPSIQDRVEHLRTLAEEAALYRKFGKASLALASMEEYESLESIEEEQVDAFIDQFENTLDSVDTSLQNQLDYNIVNHKQINTREALEEELQSGTAIPELDIRFDEEGKPWVSHSPRSGTRFLFSKQIHESTSEEVKNTGGRLSLEEALTLVEQYNEKNYHRVVI